jgi:hypothetical protein
MTKIDIKQTLASALFIKMLAVVLEFSTLQNKHNRHTLLAKIYLFALAAKQASNTRLSNSIHIYKLKHLYS